MKKLLFCLLSGTVLAFSSCQSEDPAVSGNPTDGTTTTGGNAVKFTYNAQSPSVKTYYHTDGSIRWSHDDQIAIISPVSDIFDDDHQISLYTIGENGGEAAGEFVYHDIVGTPPIYWNNADKQHFHAYYPADHAILNNSTEDGLGAITNVDPVTGAANFHVPADQTFSVILYPSDPSHALHPLSYAIAAAKDVDVNTGDAVQLEFHDFMNVLRIHLSNPFNQPVRGVKLTTTTEGKAKDLYLAGTTRVTPPESLSNGTSVQFNHLVIDNDIAYGDDEFFENTLGVDKPTPRSREVYADAGNYPLYDSDLYGDLYLLPQDYDGGTLQLTVMIGPDDSPENDIVKEIPSDFDQSSIKRVRIDIPNDLIAPDRVYMGTYDGYPMYVATGNLIAEFDPLPLWGEDTAPSGYYIAGTKLGKSKYTANDVYEGSTYLNTERDLFRGGWLNEPGFWTIDDNLLSPSTGDYSNGQSHSGDPEYDLVARELGNGWYTPTLEELQALTNSYGDHYDWIWRYNYGSKIGLNGYIVSTKPGKTPGVSSNTPITSIFLPAAGVSLGEVFNRGVSGIYWSSTHYDATDGLDDRLWVLGFTNGVQAQAQITSDGVTAAGLALRPFTNSPGPATPRGEVDFDDDGWIIQKDDDDTGHIEEVLY